MKYEYVNSSYKDRHSNTYPYFEVAINSFSNRNIILKKEDINKILEKIKQGDKFILKDSGKSVFSYPEPILDHVQDNDTVRGYEDLSYMEHLPIDIDNKDDLEQAKVCTIDIINHLEREFKVNTEYLSIYFSGDKGFHIELPSSYIGITPSSKLNEVAKIFVKKILPESAKVDYRVYDKNSLIRLQNTVNSKSGLFKIQITLDELRNSTIEEIKNAANKPREPFKLEKIEKVNRELKKLHEESRKEAFQQPQQNKNKKNQKNKSIGEEINEGERNVTLTTYAGKLLNRGLSKSEISALISACNQSYCKPPLPEKEVNSIEDSVEKYRENNDSQNATELELIKYSDLQGLPEIQWVVDGCIPYPYITTIFGKSGSGKSFFATYLSILACIGGKKFFDCEFQNRPLKTLYLDFELNRDEFFRRALKVSMGIGIQKPPDNLKYFRVYDTLNNIFAKLESSVKKEGIEFVVIDSFGKIGTDPLNPELVTRCFSKLETLGIPVLIIDHTSKGQFGDFNQSSPFGTVYKTNYSRSEFEITGKKKGENSISCELEHTNFNFGRQQDAFKFDISFNDTEILFVEQSNQKYDESDFLKVQEVIEKLHKNKLKIANQKTVIEHLKGVYPEKALITLLKQGENKYWGTKRGKKKEIIYYPLDQKSKKADPYKDKESAFLEEDVFIDEEESFPDWLR